MMNKLNFNHYVLHGYWLITQLAQRLGIWGLLGMAIMLASILFYGSNTITLEQQLNKVKLSLAQVQLSSINKEIADSDEQSIAPEQSETQRIAQFYDGLPDGTNLPKLINALDSYALKQHLVLNRGDYKLTKIKLGKVSRYEILLPVTGQYTQIRQFIAEALLEIPALALSDIQIKRENTLVPNVEARLVFVLFLKGDSW
jgi:Tfp pilus assembly protein PilO